MGLEEVVDEVMKDAREKANKIAAEARRTARNIIENARREAREYERKFREETAKIMEEMERREMAAAKLGANKIILDAKREIMENYIESVVSELATMREEKERFLERLAQLCKGEMSVDVVYCNRKDRNAIKKLFPGAKIREIQCTGGFIAVNERERISIDLTYETLVERVRRDLLKILSDAIFRK